MSVARRILGTLRSMSLQKKRIPEGTKGEPGRERCSIMTSKPQIWRRLHIGRVWGSIGACFPNLSQKMFSVTLPHLPGDLQICLNRNV